MFTGIIQKTARVIEVKPTGDAILLKISNPFSEAKDQVQLGESIANNGVCLTVTGVDEQFLTFDLSPATLTVTALGRLRTNSKVNLERSMRMGDRLSGHWVQGHVDGVAEVVQIKSVEEGFYDLILRPCEASGEPLLRYCVRKGSLTVEGISLTIQELLSDAAGSPEKLLSFQIIPHTWAETGLSDLKNGDLVNIEVDILAKYLERIIQKK